MKIFKNRGDIYIPRSKTRRDYEQKVLVSILAAVVVFTIIFVSVTASRNNYSAKEFFRPENTNVTQETQSADIPIASGKKNVMIIETDNDKKFVRLVILIQSDMDAKAFKTCTIKGNTLTSTGKSISSYYKSDGENGVVSAVCELLSIKNDYYISVSEKDMKSLFNLFGKVNYPISSDIKINKTGNDPYSLRLSAGEETIDGTKAVKLMRYYMYEGKKYKAQNDFVLSCLLNFSNEENLKNSRDIFSSAINIVKTNITVWDFTENEDAISYACNENVSMEVYGVEPQYNGKELTNANEIKGYFGKE